MLLCPVRDCRARLSREERRLVCPKGHSFDIARSGYVNLLQPQERRSKHPGDSADAVAARRRLHDRGVTRPLLDGISDLIQATSSDVVLDAGCGEGFYLGTLAQQHDFDAHGTDISIPAIDAAARRYVPSDGQREWIVANADRFVPYADGSFSLILSITARMNAPEFRRVLRDDGRFLVALAAPDDLIELRGPVGKRDSEDSEQDQELGRDRVARTVATFAEQFQLTAQRRVTTHADLDVAAVEDILLSIYRPMRSQPVEAMRVTFSLDLLLFKPL